MKSPEKSAKPKTERNTWGGPFWFFRGLCVSALVYVFVTMPAVLLWGPPAAAPVMLVQNGAILSAIIIVYGARAGLTDNVVKWFFQRKD